MEAVFWIEAVKTQWRVRGDAWVIGPDIEGGADGARAVKEALKGRMWGSGMDWDWERERMAQFWGLTEALRKGFGGPTPGTVIPREERILDEKEAQQNFRLVVIRPTEVECVDLTDEDDAKRWIYTFVEKNDGEGDWERKELYP